MNARPRLLLAGLAALVLGACATEQSPVPPAADLPAVGRPMPGGSYACNPNYDIGAQLVALWSNSPNISSATAKWNQIQHQQSINPTPSDNVTNATVNLIEFILTQYRSGNLIPPSGTDPAEFYAAWVELINELYCNAGLDLSISTLDAWILYQNDVEKTFIAAGGETGVTFPANSVPVTTIVTMDGCTTSQPLNTPLDQYPFTCNWRLQPDQPLLNGLKATVTVCASGIPAGNTDLLNRLRLGHEKNGFEILPAPGANDPAPPQLDCDPFLSLAAGRSGAIKWLAKALDALLPEKLQASMFFFGGASGATSEFSPFAPVDPRLSVVGASGTTGEFTPPAVPGAPQLNGSQPAACSYGNTVTVAGTTYPVNPEGPAGTSVAAACRPSATIQTATGTPIAGVPIAFQIGTTVGGGNALSPASNGVLRYLDAGACGATAFAPGSDGSPSAAVSGSTGLPATGADGKAAACADFGTTAGYNSIVATPQTAGLPASLQGVYFDVTSLLWVMGTNAASQLSFTQEPPAVVTAGSPFTAKVALLDRNGQQTGTTETVSLTLQNASLASPAFSGTGPFSVAAVNGEASFTNLVVTRAATGYTIGASATLPGPVAAAATSTAFDVVPGAAASIMTYMSPPLATPTYSFGSHPAFSATPLTPVVLVTDAWNNPVGAGQNVYWSPTGATGSVVSASPTTTLADGTSSAGWTLGEGLNELYATLAPVPVPPLLAAFAQFTATGTTTLVTVNSCATGGAKDDIRNFGFRTPGNAKEIRSVGLYLSITGNASSPSLFDMELTGTRTYTPKGTSTPTTDTFRSRLTVSLRGDNSSSDPENKLATFAFGGSSGFPAIPPANVNGAQPSINWRVALLDPSALPSNRTINMNAGTCSAGSTKCRLPTSCKSDELTAAGAFYRQGFPAIVKAIQ